MCTVQMYSGSGDRASCRMKCAKYKCISGSGDSASSRIKCARYKCS